MKSKLQELREKLHLTQEELAAKSTISVRTIQRIEAGTLPKGYTLRQLSETLQVSPEEFSVSLVDESVSTLSYEKTLNLITLLFLVFPYGNLIFPLLYLYKKKLRSPIAKQLLSIQIVWSLLLSVVLLALPLLISFVSAFISNDSLHKIPVFYGVVVLFYVSNLYIILRNSVSLTEKDKLTIFLKFSLV